MAVMDYHIPVLLDESVSALLGCYGAGGFRHSEAKCSSFRSADGFRHSDAKPGGRSEESGVPRDVAGGESCVCLDPSVAVLPQDDSSRIQDNGSYCLQDDSSCRTQDDGSRHFETIQGAVSGTYADVTFGGGGHSREILRQLGPEGRLMAFDKDADAIENYLRKGKAIAEAPADGDSSDEASNPTRPSSPDSRLLLIRNNFRFIHNFTMLHFPDGLDGILADLGVSSHQFDTAERGFSFRFDAPLDMRMNNKASLSAADIVNTYDEAALSRVFRLYGELDDAHKVAYLIAKARRQSPLTTTTALCDALQPLLPAQGEHKYLAKVFQALRIEVNHEMDDLEKFLVGAAKSLKQGGRLVVITYHSLEDRMVKNFIKTGSIDGQVQKDFYGNPVAPLRPVNKKPVLPCETEIQSNTRARSAKLRIAEKI